MTSSLITLPDYHEQSPEVAARFKKLHERPVILKVDQLTKIFEGHEEKRTALDRVSFEIHRREFVCVIGPSGCGKSTLIRILAGLDEPTSGVVLLDDKQVSGPGPDRGMVFQGYTLFPWLTVKKNVMFGLELAGNGPTTAASEALQWIEMVGLSHVANAYPHQLSGGMKQRVAIARALANRPRILLMDEPYGALDPTTRCKMQSYLMQIWRQVDVTILFVTHDLDEAVLLSDRILVLGTNPSQILEVLEVPVPRPRSVEQMLTPEFLATKRRIEELIHGPADAEPATLPDIRLTMAGDDVE